jgi:hypothetical protein
MDNHAAEENRVKPRKWGVEARDQSPGDGKEGITGVMNFAGVFVCLWLKSVMRCFLFSKFGGKTYTTHHTKYCLQRWLGLRQDSGLLARTAAEMPFAE